MIFVYIFRFIFSCNELKMNFYVDAMSCDIQQGELYTGGIMTTLPGNQCQQEAWEPLVPLPCKAYRGKYLSDTFIGKSHKSQVQSYKFIKFPESFWNFLIVLRFFSGDEGFILPFTFSIQGDEGNMSNAPYIQGNKGLWSETCDEGPDCRPDMSHWPHILQDPQSH